MDGDEEQQSAAVAVCDGATGDGAEQSGDAAPSTAEEEPRAAGSAMADPADPADPADVDTEDAATVDVEEAVPDETPGESADVEDDGPALVDVGDDEAVGTRRPRSPTPPMPRPCSSERSWSGPPRGDSARICDEVSSLSSRSEWSPSP